MRKAIFTGFLLVGIFSPAVADQLFGESGHNGARKMIRTLDGGYIVVGWADQQGVHEKGSGLLVRFDASGALQWQKTLAKSGRNQATAVLQREDSSFVVALEEYPHEDAPGQVVLFELGEDGEILAQHEVGGSGSDVADALVQTSDGGYVLAGESSASPDQDMDAWMIKLSPSFEQQWEWRDGTDGRDRFNDLVLLEDGSLVAAGNATTLGPDGKTDEQAWWVKFDADGNVRWSHRMTQGRSASVRGIAAGSNGGFVFSGFSKNPLDRSFDSWLGLINSAGDILWQQFLDIEGADYLHAIDRNENKEYIAAGARKVPGSEQYQALLIRFPESGRQPEVSFHGESGSHKARAIITTGTGDYVLAGTAKPAGGDRQQLWFYQNPKKMFMSNP